MVGADGLPVVCEKCHRPATMVGWGLGKLWWLLPLFPRRVAYCDEHRPDRATGSSGAEGERGS